MDSDTFVHQDTLEIAELSCGAVVDAARMSVKERRTTFALVRPPGHHAGPGYGGGFCYLNNVAVAAARLVDEGERVCILDIDVHHGNGTADIFRREPRILYVSTHQKGIFPGTGPLEDLGGGAALGHLVHLPFPSGCGDATYRTAFEELVSPIVKSFRPGAILVSLGVDAHYKDPLASLTLSSLGYLDLFDRIAELGGTSAEGRLCIALEGGYHLAALSEVLASWVGRSQGRTVPLEHTKVHDQEGLGIPLIQQARKVLSAHWPTLSS